MKLRRPVEGSPALPLVEQLPSVCRVSPSRMGIWAESTPRVPADKGFVATHDEGATRRSVGEEDTCQKLV